MEHVASQVIFAAVAVASAGNAESPVLDLTVGATSTPYTIALRASSVSGTADVQLQVQESEDGTNFDDYADHPNVIDSTLLAKPTGPELWNEYPLTDAPNKFLRFKVTGIAANPADTLVSAKFLFRERI